MGPFAQLTAPFAPDKVSWRVGSTTQDKKRGLALAYIDARDVMERLDAVFGPQGWQCRYPHANGKTVCEIGIKAGDEWIWKADGAGDTDVEAEKGALSDAFKRAAVRWGVGRYLYDVESPWVELEPAGRSFKIKDSEHARLRKLLGGSVPIPAAPAPAATQPTTSLLPPEMRAPPADNTSLDSTALGSDLIKEIRNLHSLNALDRWAAANKERIGGLREPDKERVRGEYAKQKSALTQSEGMAA